MAWHAPTAEEESGDGGALAGRRVRVEGFGEGTVRAFSRCDAAECPTAVSRDQGQPREGRDNVTAGSFCLRPL